eukprot:6928057-Alexandrium_andersonii.AAC.1
MPIEPPVLQHVAALLAILEGQAAFAVFRKRSSSNPPRAWHLDRLYTPWMGWLSCHGGCR